MAFKFNIHRRPNSFSVRMRSYDEGDKLKHGKQGANFVEINLPKNEWARYGFNVDWTVEQLTAHCKTLNAMASIEQKEERQARVKYVVDSQIKDALNCAYLPEHIVSEFEKKLEYDSYSENFKDSKIYYHWRTTMRIIAKLEMAPGDWSDNNRAVLKKMEGLAPSTITRIIHLMNNYGAFYSKRMGKYFGKVAKPKGVEIGRISDKYLDKTGGKTKEAKGISLSLMNIIADSSELTQPEKDWCVVCLGFGLRPIEVSEVANRDKKTLVIGKTTVKIYQSKLVSLPRNLRFKEVVITHPFQKAALSIIKSDKELSQPSIYMLRKVIGDEYGLYSFRKGYTDIMISLGEPIERISMDLGHSSIERTWKSYRKRISNS